MIGYKIIKKQSWAEIHQKLQTLMKDISLATEFVREIQKGNMDVTIGDKINNATLQTSLTDMRNQMKKYSLSEKQRNWVNEGLAMFVQILRSGDDKDRQELADSIIKNLVTYLHANQGALYALNDDDPQNIFLEMEACYAYQRKKYLHKRIELGEGLVGQVVLEKSSLYLKEVPKDFIKITSGLGEALPRNVLLVPLKLEDKIYGVVELASFQLFEAYEIDFVERLGESIASSIAAVKSSERTKGLLKETQLQAEQLKSQEEEVRQNLEELSATQEAMQRAMKEVELKEAYISQILNTSQDIIYSVDGDFKLITWNTAFAREAERVGVQLQKGIDAFGWSASERQKLIPLFMKVFEGETFEITYESIIEGKVFHFLSLYAPLRSPHGEIIEAGVYARNITPIVEAQHQSAQLLKEAQIQNQQLKEREEELRQNMEELAATQEGIQRAMADLEAKEAYARELMNATDDLIYTVDRDYRFVTWNKAFTRAAEQNHFKLEKHMDAFEWIPHYRASLLPLWARALRGETFHFQWENEREGKKEYYHSIFAPIHTSEGEITEAVVFARNVAELVEAKLESSRLLKEAQMQTEELKAQEEELRQNMEELAATQEQIISQHKKLQESEEITRTIFNSSPFGIIRLNKEGGFVLCNDHIKQLLCMKDGSTLHFNDVFRTNKLDKLHVGDKKRIKVFPVDGKPFMAELIVSTLQEDLLFFLRDVTREIQQQHELVKSLEQAEMLKQELMKER
jgi:PAS domain-containing protein